MPNKLFESDFWTVNLKDITNNQKSTGTAVSGTNSATNAVDQGAPTEAEAGNVQKLPEKGNWKAWGEEYKKRVEDNKKMSSESKISDYDLESKFFKDFFNTNWEQSCAKQLMLMGTPLRKAIKVLGFDAALNPILAFILIPYVQDELIKTKLLNVNTFKAIYNAKAEKLVADTEFLKSCGYNIIYCKDLYKKSVSEMEEYLKLQSKTLKTSAKKYTINDQIANIKVFFEINSPEIQSQDKKKRALEVKNIKGIEYPNAKYASTKLNSIELANEIAQQISSNIDPKDSKTHINSKSQQALADKLDRPSKILAAIQFLSLTTGSTKAKEALSNEKLGGVSTNELIKATSQIAGFMPKGQLRTADADALVGLLLSKL